MTVATPAAPARSRLEAGTPGMRCNIDHGRIKADDVAWASLEYVGVQPGYDDEDRPDPRFDLELRNCACGSTLCRPARKA